ncbi:collagen alpha-1(III) chain-like [Mustela erminea]|uniref:collagen alpha-1(III) chain-like n=1 Tax=Mustela erminea TaxID=36723 RepID=UPI001387426E|nr:collagen alpha-1(III) chain-like [Mustela erminea]
MAAPLGPAATCGERAALRRRRRRRREQRAGGAGPQGAGRACSLAPLPALGPAEEARAARRRGSGGRAPSAWAARAPRTAGEGSAGSGLTEGPGLPRRGRRRRSRPGSVGGSAAPRSRQLRSPRPARRRRPRPREAGRGGGAGAGGPEQPAGDPNPGRHPPPRTGPSPALTAADPAAPAPRRRSPCASPLGRRLGCAPLWRWRGAARDFYPAGPPGSKRRRTQGPAPRGRQQRRRGLQEERTGVARDPAPSVTCGRQRAPRHGATGESPDPAAWMDRFWAALGSRGALPLTEGNGEAVSSGKHLQPLVGQEIQGLRGPDSSPPNPRLLLAAALTQPSGHCGPGWWEEGQPSAEQPWVGHHLPAGRTAMGPSVDPTEFGAPCLCQGCRRSDRGGLGDSGQEGGAGQRALEPGPKGERGAGRRGVVARRGPGAQATRARGPKPRGARWGVGAGPRRLGALRSSANAPRRGPDSGAGPGPRGRGPDLGGGARTPRRARKRARAPPPQAPPRHRVAVRPGC